MKAFDVDNPYFRTKVLTASPAELRMMLIEGCIRFIQIGRGGLETRDYESVFEGFSQARAIVLELINAMHPEVEPELCGRLTALYTYIHRLLTEASFEKSIAKADEAIGLMEYERETWAMVMEKLKRELGEQGAGTEGETVGQGAGGDRVSLSVEG
jgi:flagellar protein FliS